MKLAGPQGKPQIRFSIEPLSPGCRDFCFCPWKRRMLTAKLCSANPLTMLRVPAFINQSYPGACVIFPHHRMLVNRAAVLFAAAGIEEP